MLPSSIEDFGNPELAAIINKTQRSASMGPEGKVKFLKAAWDAIGSEFGSRHTQYEMFYAGARFVTCGHSFRTFDWGTPPVWSTVCSRPTICRQNSTT